MKKEYQVVLHLLQVGLWDLSPNVDYLSHDLDWELILKLASDQTIVGIIADALVKLPPELRPPKSIYFLIIKKADEIEKENIKMYERIPMLVKSFRDRGVQVILLKGQGVGLSYNNPYRRTSGDVDFYTGYDANQFEKAKLILKELHANGFKELAYKKHVESFVDDIKVEIHGEIHFRISRRFDTYFEEWMKECFSTESVVVKKKNNNEILLPPYRFDAIFIFAHALNHYMNGGVGLRQLCDWMCYLKKNNSKIDNWQLEKDLDFLGLTKYWKYLAAMAVERLGMEKEKMPLYDGYYGKYKDKLLLHVFSTGNFGNLQKQNHNKHELKLWKKIKTFYGQLFLYWDNFLMFPKDTIHCFKFFVVNNIVNYN